MEENVRAFVGTSSCCTDSQSNDVNKLVAPHLGMKFNSVDEAKTYYREFGKQEGFEIRVRTTDKKQTGVELPSSCLLVCSHEGVHNKKEEIEGVASRSTSTIRCGCQARMRVTKRKLEDIYDVSLAENRHSHGFVTPSKRQYMKGNKNMPEAAKSLTEVFHDNGIPVGKVADVFHGDEIGFRRKHCWNHHYGLTRKMPKDNDATAVLHYFRQKSAENPQFYYAVQLDTKGVVVNFFWVDGRSRVQYEYFGDVVSFDTTYRTNVYGMPFAPFTGVNHHMQSIQFGCALLLDETEETFVWLFQTWLAAMGGRPPTSILTDQDLAMTAAVRRVFPTIRHRFCLWHIMQKFSEKLSFVYHRLDALCPELTYIIWKSYRIVDFESRWSALLWKYNLTENTWLTEIYKNRTSWVPAYHNDIFFAGIHTTGRSESMNSHYDQFVSSTTTLMEFVHGNERSLESIARNERESDYRTEHTSRIVAKDTFLLKHAGKVYTISAFNKFKKHLEKAKMKYRIVGEEIDIHGTRIYTVKTRDIKQTSIWKVTFNRGTLEGDCECKNFQFEGLLCAHILKLFQRYDIEEIPDHFILKRWTQKANTYRAVFDGGLVAGHEDHEPLRVAHCIKVATQLAYDASTSVETYAYFIQKMSEMSIGVSELKETINKTDAMNNEAPPIEEPIVDTSQLLVLNPNISQTKGRKKKTERMKGPREEALENPGRMCKSCNKIAKHDSRNCPEKLKNKSVE